MSKIGVFAVIAMVLVAFCVMPVAAANADNDLYTSKYKATPMDFPTTGSLTGIVRCANNLQTVGMTMTLEGSNVTTPIDLRADGTFDVNDLAPGRYIINVAVGNGGQPEQSSVTIQAGYVSYMEKEILGYAVSPADIEEEKDVITVTSAIYGMQRVVIICPAIPATPGTPAIPGVPAVPGTPAIPATPGTPAVPAVPAVPAQPATQDTYTIVSNGPYTGYATQSYYGGFDFKVGNTKYDICNGYCYGAVKYLFVEGRPAIPATPAIPAIPAVPGTPAIPATPGTPAIPGVPAVPGTPAIPAVTQVQGSFIDVTDELQQAIDGGAREVIFDNRPATGGIFAADGTTLLVEIDDPAYGQVKSVVINVEINGVAKTINGMEYELLTI